LSSSPSPNSKQTIYRVKQGDTLVGIAYRFGTSSSTLVRWNDLDDPDEIEPGDELLVPARAMRKGTPSATRYAGGQLGWPVDGGNVVSVFGPRSGSFHDGLDIAGPEGIEVYAAHDGVVAYSNDELPGYGELIILKSNSSLMTVYAHNSRRYVRVGQRVKRGDKIAEVGETGHASGPHLHFEVRVRDPDGKYVAVDPAPLLQKNTKPSLRYRINESLTPILAKLNALSTAFSSKE